MVYLSCYDWWFTSAATTGGLPQLLRLVVYLSCYDWWFTSAATTGGLPQLLRLVVYLSCYDWWFTSAATTGGLPQLLRLVVYLSCYDWWFTFAMISVEVFFSKNSSLFSGSLLPCAVQSWYVRACFCLKSIVLICFTRWE